MTDAILGAPYAAHSEEFRVRLATDVERIIFYDGGIVVRRQNGAWKIEIDGPMNEAARFIQWP